MEYPNTTLALSSSMLRWDQDLEIRVYFITPINNINAITHSGPNKICTEFILGLSQRPQVGILFGCLDSLKLQSILETSLCVKI